MSELENRAAVTEPCVLCGDNAAAHSLQTQQFAYRDGSNEVLLTAAVPVVSCAACGETYTAPGAEEAQHEAVCRYLGRLTPAEIRALRSRLALSQAKLAERTGIGIASIKRWECGTMIQNASLNAQLRSLEEVSDLPWVARPTPRWQTELKPEMFEAAKLFELRPKPFLQAA